MSCNDDKIVVVNPGAFDADPDTIVAAAAAVHCKEWAQVREGLLGLVKIHRIQRQSAFDDYAY